MGLLRKLGHLTVSEDGMIELTLKQWKFFLKFSKSKAKTIQGQKRAITKLIEDAIRMGIKNRD